MVNTSIVVFLFIFIAFAVILAIAAIVIRNTGPETTKGPKGDTGPQGNTGDKGANGPQGPAGQIVQGIYPSGPIPEGVIEASDAITPYVYFNNPLTRNAVTFQTVDVHIFGLTNAPRYAILQTNSSFDTSVSYSLEEYILHGLGHIQQILYAQYNLGRGIVTLLVRKPEFNNLGHLIWGEWKCVN